MIAKLQDNNLFSVKTYDYCAGVYEERFMDITSYKDEVDKFCRHLLSFRSRILDLGCGPGNYSKYLSDNGFRNITGVDLSDEMIRRAKKNVPEANFLTADVRALKMEPSSFHGVLSSFCIPYLSYHDTEKLIGDIATLLKPSGTFYLSCMEGTHAGFEQTSFSGEMAVYIYYYTEEFLVGAMEDKGLQVESVTRLPYFEPEGRMSTDLVIMAHKP